MTAIANVWRRAAAFLIEAALFWAAVWVVLKVTGAPPGLWETGTRLDAFGTPVEGGFTFHFPPNSRPVEFLLCAHFAYVMFMETRSGQTLGKRQLGIRVVDFKTGKSPNLGQASIRYVFLYIGAIGLFIPTLIMASTSSYGQRLGDRVAGTIVVGKDATWPPIVATVPVQSNRQ